MHPCLSQGKKREFKFQQLKETYIDEPADITPFVDQLDEALKERVLQLQKGRWDTWLITCIMDILSSQLHKSHFCGSFSLSDTETHCEVMQEIVDLILEVSFAQGEYFELSFKHGWLFTHFFFFFLFPFVLFQEDFDSEQMSTLASCLAELFKSHFRGDVLPEEITEEYVSLTFPSDFLPGRLAHYPSG